MQKAVYTFDDMFDADNRYRNEELEIGMIEEWAKEDDAKKEPYVNNYFTWENIKGLGEA